MAVAGSGEMAKQEEQTGSGTGYDRSNPAPPVMDFLKGSTACPNSTTNLELNTAYEGHFFYLNHHSMHNMGCIIHDVPHRITYNAFLSTYPVMWNMTILNLNPHVSNLLSVNSFEAEDPLKMGRIPYAF